MAIQQILLGLGAKDYEIERSIRNDQGTADVNSGSNFEHTYSSAGNQKTFTISVWVKKCGTPGNLGDGDDQYSIFSTGGGGSGAQQGNLFFYNDDSFRFTSQPQPSANAQFVTNRKFRDPSAWYHIVVAVDTTQATQSNRVKIYINGVQETDFSTATYPSQNDDLQYNIAARHRIGSNSLGSNLSHTYGNHNGYIAEFNFIDGTALTPSSFGETNSKTGQWVPKKFSGSYGTNGFHLNFSDNSNTTAATLGKDSSGNGNNFTPNNFVTGDSVKDSPTNNFATFRLYGTPAASGASLAEGNLKFTTGSSGSARNLNRQGISTFLPTYGKWYAEVRVTGGDENNFIGVSAYQLGIAPTSNNSRYVYYYGPDGEKYVNTNGSESNSTHGAGYGNDDIVGIYIDMDAGTPTVYFSKNGQWADGSGNSDESTPTSGITLGDTFFTTDAGGHTGIGIIVSSASSGSSVNYQANFGQDSTFSGLTTAGGNTDANAIGDFKYTVPTGAKAMCTANLSDPTIKLPDKHFDTLLWTGNSTDNRAITGLNFQPDFTWIKRRSGGAMSHFVVDSLRSNTDSGGGNGNDGPLTTNSNATEAAQTDGGFESFNSDGFTLGKGSSTANADAPYQRNNASSETYVAWNWKGGGSAVSNSDGGITSSVSANNTAGFSVLTYTGTGSQTTVGHGLGAKPKVIITKLRDTNTQDWMLYPKQLTGTGATYIKFNTTDTVANDAHTYPDVEPTTTVYTVGGDDGGDGTNGNGKGYVAYCFAEVANYSKFGSYKGNQNANGPFIYLGFTPAFLLIKNIDDASNRQWCIIDATRTTINKYGSAEVLFANDSQSESVANNNYGQFASKSAVDILSNGFKVREGETSAYTQLNRSNTHIYLAFAEAPFKYSRAH